MKTTKTNRIAGKTAVGFLMVFLIILALTAKPVAADTVSNESTVDFVLVVDCSGSMSINDPNGLTAVAAKKFIDKLPTDKVRLSIIAMGDDYKEKAYPIGQADPNSAGRVQEVFALQDIADQAAKNKASDIVGDITKQMGAYTPLGYALQAASEILESGKASKGNAAIILISDGQVDGETDYGSDKKEFKSIDVATSMAADSEWPIYCMELNYKKENKKGDGLPGVAYHQMRENIPAKTGTEPIELTSATEAEEAFDKIIARFFGEGVERQEGTGSVNKPFNFKVEEFTAETTVTVTCDTSKIANMELSHGGKIESYQVGNGSQNLTDRVIHVENTFLTIKMVTPEEGDWTLTVYGPENVDFDWTAISIREMDLQLSSPDTGGKVSVTKGTTVNFTAGFAYKGKPYSIEKFYQNHPAKFCVEGGETINMQASGAGYAASYKFNKEGSYRVYAVVEDPLFRGGNKKSGVLTYYVDNNETVAKGTIPDQEAAVRGSTNPIDLTAYFDSQDGDTLSYTLVKDRTADYTGDISKDGKLILTAGEKSKAFTVGVEAGDGTDGDKVLQEFTFNVSNQPVELIGADVIDIDLIVDADTAPGFILNMANAEGSGNGCEFKWADYFSDPDGTAPIVRVFENTDSGIVRNEREDGMSLNAEKACTAEYNVIAIDGNDLKTQKLLTINVHASSATAAAVDKVRIPLIILLVILVALVALLVVMLGGRKIYGIWDVSTSTGDHEEERELGTLRSGKKSHVRVDMILRDLQMETGIGKVELNAGSRPSGKVFLTKFDELDNVEVDGTDVEDLKKEKKISIRSGSSIVLSKEGFSVTLERIR